MDSQLGLHEFSSERLLAEQDATGVYDDKEYGRRQLGIFRKPTTDMGALFKRFKAQNKDESQNRTQLEMPPRRILCCLQNSRLGSFLVAVEDWMYLALLGIIMAVFSIAMDVTVEFLQAHHLKYYTMTKTIHPLLAYVVWVLYVVILITLSSLCAHYIARQAIGSGIPEMKTIMRGVVVKEYLSARTLISKMSSLTLSLGSGLPMGKEGPFVHIASIVANLLSKLSSNSANAFENESRSTEMLAAGCAVGVACTFSAPVGGVLFSIEVTAVYFAVRNYWRGFFAASCSALVFAMLRICKGMVEEVDEVTMEAHFQTYFPSSGSFVPQELLIFALLGLTCGVLGGVYVLVHRKLVLFLKANKVAQFLFKRYWLMYPIVVSLFISSLTFPMGIGMFLGGERRFGNTLADFFVDCSWIHRNNSSYSCLHHNNNISMENWTGENLDDNIFFGLAFFQFSFFFLTIIATTLPVPTGIFMSVFVLGAALGRSVGEALLEYYPLGLLNNNNQIRPGVYAVVGAAAFTGAATHTVSIAVIVFELTGQLTLLLPVMIAVLMANAIASLLGPSIYDSIIVIKDLPYLPDLRAGAGSAFHKVLVEDFMVSPVKFICKDSSYAQLQGMLAEMPKLKAFPLVESDDNRVLIGSINKWSLFTLLENKVGVKARQSEARRRIKEALDNVDKRYQMAREESIQKDDSFDATDSSVPLVITPPEHEQTAVKKKRFTVKPVNSSSALSPRKKSSVDEETGISQNAKAAIFAMGSKKKKRDDEDVYHTISGIFRSIGKISFGRHPKNTDKETEFDLHAEDRSAWEEKVLSEIIDFTDCPIDSAPFQLVEHTSLPKVHSLFSLLGLGKAYVTLHGKLIGVVSLKELRSAIERVQNHQPVVPPRKCAQIASSSTISDEDSEELDFIFPKLEIVNPHDAPPTVVDTKVDEPVAVEIPETPVPSEAPSRKVTRSESLSAINSAPLFHSTPNGIPKQTSIDESKVCLNNVLGAQSNSSFLQTTDSNMERSESRLSTRRNKNLHVQIRMPSEESTDSSTTS